MTHEPKKIITNYVISQKGAGAFLPSDDHAIIDKWLSITKDPFEIIFALDNLINNSPSAKRRRMRLSYFEKQVSKQISK